MNYDDYALFVLHYCVVLVTVIDLVKGIIEMYFKITFPGSRRMFFKTFSNIKKSNTL